MAADDIRVKFSGDASSYNDQIKKMVAQNKALQSELKRIDSALEDEMSAEKKAEKRKDALNKQIDAQTEYIKELEAEQKRLKDSTEDTTLQELKLEDQISKAKSALNGMKDQVNAAESATDEYGNEASDAAGQTEKFVDELSKMEAGKEIADILGRVSDKFAELGENALNAAKELDAGYDTIAKRTGASGENLAEMNSIADDLYSTLPAAMEDVGDAVGEVNTRLGLSGDELRDTSELFLKFARINDTDVSTSIDTVQKALAAFGLGADDTERILNVMTAAGQSSGVGMNELAGAMVKNAGALSELGLSAEQSIMFIGKLEKSGVDSETALSGMSRALKNATKQGVPLNEALENLEDTILNGSGGMDGLTTAYELFGKSGDKIYNALKTGSVSFKNLTEDVADYSGTVENTYQNTLSAWDKTAVALNNVKIAGSELAGEALEAIAPLLDEIVEIVRKGVKWFKDLPDPVKKVAGVIGLLGVGAGKVVPKISGLFGTIQQFKSAKAILELAKAQKAAEDFGTGAGKAGGMFSTGFLNPITLVSAASVAFVAAMAGINEAINNNIEKEYGLTDAQQELVDSIHEHADALQEAATIRDESIAGIDAEFDHIKELAAEYDTLIDANGEVKKGYEDRAAYILNEMSNATGKSIEDIKAEVKANGSLVDSIDEVIEKKRAEATLSAYESSYAEAVQNVAQAEREKLDAMELVEQREAAYNAKLAEGNSYRAQQAALEEQLANARGRGDTEYYQSQLAALNETHQLYNKELAASKAALDEANTAMTEASDRYTTYQNTIANYEGLSAAIISGDQAKIEQALTDLVNNFVTATNGTEEELKEQLSNAKDYLGKMESAFENGEIDAAALDAAKRAVKAASEELRKFEQIGKDADQGMVNGMEWNRAMVQSKARQIGLLAVQSTAAGAETNSPSRATQRTGQDVDQGLVVGMENGKTSVTNKGREVGQAATGGVKNGIDTDGITAAGGSVGDALGSGIESKKERVKTAAGALKTATEDAKTSYDTAKSWGEIVGDALADGMESKDWRVRKSSQILADAAKSNIHFSLPDEGPLRHVGEWGPEMVSKYVRGIESSLPKLENASLRMAAATAPTMPGTTTNSLTYGDIVVNVNGAGVQNEELLARKISDSIFRQVRAQKAVW